MLFSRAKDARVYAQMQTIQTHKQHVVVKDKQWLCPPKTYLGKDHVHGFAVILGSHKN